jgi:predicted ATPase
MMQQINTFSVELTVSGNSEITVGDIVEYDGSIYNTVEKDRYISGKYLVTAVNHFISRDGYKSIVTISRDSVLSDGSEPDATPGA